MKLKSIRLKNFKQFNDFSIISKDINILVGPNNSGKSTTLDALRILSDVIKYANRRNPQLATQSNYGVCPTYEFSPSQLSVSTTNCVRNYGEDAAEIAVVHDNGNLLHIAVHPDRQVCAYINSSGPIIRSATQFKKQFPLDIVIVPTLGPLEVDEQYVSFDTVKKNENTRLAHRNFRNILLQKTERERADFADLVSYAWKGVEVQSPVIMTGVPSTLSMFFTENRMTREVASSGFGFQVWMQMMLQVMRGKPDSLLVLDEPDIYLHPDLQRKLVNLVKERFGQVFIATHSTEIINEANSGDIVSIDSRHARARRISTESGFREIFNYLGSSENAEFARMARARRILFFEGHDRKILRKFARKVGLAKVLDDTDTLFLKTGGFGQWRRVIGVGWTVENVFKMNVQVAALFDRDYRCSAEIETFKGQINADNICCHVLSRKEIENYALERPSLVRALKKASASTAQPLTDHDANELIDSTLASFHEDVRSQLISNNYRYKKIHDPHLNEASIFKELMREFDKSWADDKNKFMLVPGKMFISSLTTRLQEKCNVSLTINKIIDEMSLADIDPDLIHVIKDIDDFLQRNA